MFWLRTKKIIFYLCTLYIYIYMEAWTVILLPAYPASFAHNFVSGMQSGYTANPRMQ